MTPPIFTIAPSRISATCVSRWARAWSERRHTMPGDGRSDLMPPGGFGICSASRRCSCSAEKHKIALVLPWPRRVLGRGGRDTVANRNLAAGHDLAIDPAVAVAEGRGQAAGNRQVSLAGLRVNVGCRATQDALDDFDL